MSKGPLEVRFSVVDRTRKLRWNTTAGMFLAWEHGSVFTDQEIKMYSSYEVCIRRITC